MIAIPSNGKSGIWLAELENWQFPELPFVGEFALFLVIEGNGCSVDVQGVLAEYFVRSGCRYAVCYGPTSSSWDDAIDMVSVMDEVEGREGPFVTTTWHDDDDLGAAVFYFSNSVEIDKKAPSNYLVLHQGCSEGMKRKLAGMLKRAFSSGPPG